MPTRLQRRGSDPNNKGRGSGVYYHRGNGVYSKYSVERDKKIIAKGFKLSKVGLPKTSKILHTGDGQLPI